MNSRFALVVMAALQRTIMMAETFEDQARRAHDRWAKRYLYLLAAKKREQQVTLERLIRNEQVKPGIQILLDGEEITQSAEQLYRSSLREIFEFACRMAGKDLALFYDLCSDQIDDFRIQALQSMLVRSVKKSFGDIRAGYLRFVARQEQEFQLPFFQEREMAQLSMG